MIAGPDLCIAGTASSLLADQTPLRFRASKLATIEVSHEQLFASGNACSMAARGTPGTSTPTSDQ